MNIQSFAAAAVLVLGLSQAGWGQEGHVHPADPSPAGANAGSELTLEIEVARRATERYRDHAAARADGFRLFGSEGPLMGEHWYHPDRVGEPFDPARPSTLQYATIDGERVLVGVAYTVYQRPGEPLPEGFAGSDDHWHVHDVEQMARVLVEDRPVLRWIVDRRARTGKLGAGDGRTRLVMVHAWIWSDNPAGLFAQEHPALPYLRAGLSTIAVGNSDAAQGIALIAPGACENEVDRFDRLLSLSTAQTRALRELCNSSAASVSAVARGSDYIATNAAAGAAWREYANARSSILTASQRGRIAALENTMVH